MFKVLLIVYIVGGGSSIEYTTNFVFQEFHSIEDCKAAQTEMSSLRDSWTYKSDDIIPAHYSTSCIEMTATGYTTPSAVEVEDPPPPVPSPPAPVKKHKRWDQ